MKSLYLDYCRRHNVQPDESAPLLLGDKDPTPLARRLNVIVPVSYAVMGERVIASAYPVLRTEFAAFLHTHGENLFSDGAFSALDGLLLPYAAPWGYMAGMFAHRYAYSCVLSDPDAVHADCILPQTARLTPDRTKRPSLVTMNTTDCAARGAYCIENEAGEICAIASVNRVSGAAHCVEIGVECAPAYRRRGYASSCVAALSRDLTREGKTVLYQHYHTNRGSAAVAKRVGFTVAGRFFAYSLQCIRKDSCKIGENGV